MQRLFLGLDLSPQEKMQIDRWREQALPFSEHNVKPENFHITLVFLGMVDSDKQVQLEDMMASIVMPKFELQLDAVGYWAKPKIHFIAPNIIPDELVVLQRQCESLAIQCKINIESREYRPHVTLQRKIKTPSVALFDPSITIKADAFHLFVSHSTHNGMRYGVRYDVLNSQRAKATNSSVKSIRQQLMDGEY